MHKLFLSTLVICLTMGIIAPVTWGQSLNSRAHYQVKKIRANLAYLERTWKFGYKRKVQKMYPSLIEDKYQALLRTFPDAAGHPVLLKLRAEMLRLKARFDAPTPPVGDRQAPVVQPVRPGLRRDRPHRLPRRDRPFRRDRAPQGGGGCLPAVCHDLVRKYDHCPYGASSTPSVRSATRRDVDHFMGKLRAAATSRRGLVQFYKANPGCCQGRVRQMHERCQQAQANFQKKWNDYLSFIKTSAHNRNSSVARYAIKMNQHPYLRQDVSFLRRRISANSVASAKASAASAARTARTLCPQQRPAFRNGGLHGVIRAPLRRQFHRRLRSGLQERLGRYTLTSRPRRAFNRRTMTLYELVDTRVCVRQTWPRKWGQKVKCKAFNVSVRRSRPHGSKRWNAWRYFITRGHYAINCNSYR